MLLPRDVSQGQRATNPPRQAQRHHVRQPTMAGQLPFRRTHQPGTVPRHDQVKRVQKRLGLKVSLPTGPTKRHCAESGKEVGQGTVPFKYSRV